MRSRGGGSQVGSKDPGPGWAGLAMAHWGGAREPGWWGPAGWDGGGRVDVSLILSNLELKPSCDQNKHCIAPLAESADPCIPRHTQVIAQIQYTVWVLLALWSP